ncbi:HPr family phosphocarrier protein [Thermobifida halotolerans]|uniref:Phosphocarrier protein HPr n=1 Tax=Thermobifida halotolerans TaxID=483545 RepID=A0A399G1E9_9ACTN|nr:HPr family phosphocarrier protein [Thermobifida halotolerans]UOE18197.1 HPr family phosphocarrier protein [Thermobifida halotolerans]
MAERRVTVASPVGLHARPAARFVAAAAAFDGEVRVARPGGAGVPATSMLAVLTLGVRSGEEIVVTAEGEGAEELLDRLAEIAAADED